MNTVISQVFWRLVSMLLFILMFHVCGLPPLRSWVAGMLASLAINSATLRSEDFS